MDTLLIVLVVLFVLGGGGLGILSLAQVAAPRALYLADRPPDRLEQRGPVTERVVRARDLVALGVLPLVDAMDHRAAS